MRQTFSHSSKVHFTPSRTGHRQIHAGQAPAAIPTSRIPRVSRLMALAICFEDLIHNGEMKDYADIAGLGYVSRARLTQIMNLLQLAPDIQEEILFLPLSEKGRDLINERNLRPITAVVDWKKQRLLWRELKTGNNIS